MNFLRRARDKAALLLILAATGFLSFFSIGKEGYSNTYYAAAVKSMLMSWHNFFFVSFDPGGYVSVDKPPVALWIEAASARLFGFHGWSLILPQALAAVISVALLYHLVQRTFGKTTGLIAALVMALTPVLAAVSRTNELDSTLVMVLLLAAWALIVAAERSSLKLLLLSVTLVGIGFNVKMLEAFMVLPSFYLVYWLFSSLKTGRKIAHLSAATALLLVVSLSWAVIVDMTPATQRPYVGSSKTNSVLELAIGYNGVQRLLGMGGPGGTSGAGPGSGSRPAVATTPLATPGNNSQQQAQGTLPPGPNPPSGTLLSGGLGPTGGGPGGGTPGGGGGGFGFSGGNPGVFRFLDQEMSGQISWLFPLAFLGIGAACLRARRREPFEQKSMRALVFWGMWLLPMLVFFSIAGFFHLYYLVMLAPGVAALVGIGLTEMYRLYADERSWQAYILPAALVADAALQVFILSRYPLWSTWLTPVAGGLSGLCALGLVILKVRGKIDLKCARIAVAGGLVALLAAPAVWAVTPMIYGSNTITPYAGPELAGNSGPWRTQTESKSAPPFADNRGDTSQLIDFLLQNSRNEKYLVAVPSAMAAAPIILQTGKAVMAVGGFSGSDNILTVQRLQQMVGDGELRYFMVGGEPGSGPGGTGNQSAVTGWVETHGTLVQQFANQQLYDLSSGKTS
ncbi:MAG TPA: glycosyltransferase family 39 protein [Spirochaetia bacterium]|nr:glycosyltransferase family 39 protein [Spirochaetia bacterium]